MDRAAILEKCLDFRKQRRFDLAFAHIQEAVKAGHSDLKVLAWQHSPIFWSDISAGICMLTRRCAEDADFLREIWKDTDFVYDFHRHSASLPESSLELQRILNQEMSSIISEAHAIHWIVRDSQRRPWGLLSLCEISLTNRRAEVLLGVLPGAPTGMAAAAMLILFQFYFHVMKFNKLVSIIYEDNAHSLESTIHLGFKTEGHLRDHTIDPRSGRFLDMIQLGIFKEEAMQPANQRLMERLLSSRKKPSANRP